MALTRNEESGKRNGLQGDVSRFRVQHTPLWRAATHRLRTLILSGEIKAGEHLVETDLAELLGVSRGPIRQALQHLEQEGFVEILPRQGTFVVEMTPELVHEKYELRRLLEVYAIRRAARAATDEDIDTLLEHCARMEQAVASQDIEAFYRTQYEFHRTIVAMARMPSLLKMWDVMGVGIGSLMMLNLYYANSEPLTKKSWQSGTAIGSLTAHRDLTDIVRASDGKTAAEAMAAHLDTGERAVLGALNAARKAWQAQQEGA